LGLWVVPGFLVELGLWVVPGFLIELGLWVVTGFLVELGLWVVTSLFGATVGGRCTPPVGGGGRLVPPVGGRGRCTPPVGGGGRLELCAEVARTFANNSKRATDNDLNLIFERFVKRRNGINDSMGA
ncbi:6047_t:CDS:1, partial [Racocetra persica]